MRPIRKPELGELVKGAPLKTDGTYFLFDLAREEKGYPELSVIAANRTKLRLSWGEHILDGRVRREIEGRDFSVELAVPEGKTEFSSYFLRLGARYLQIECEDNLRVEYCGLRAAYYPHAEKTRYKASSPLRQKYTTHACALSNSACTTITRIARGASKQCMRSTAAIKCYAAIMRSANMNLRGRRSNLCATLSAPTDTCLFVFP